MTNSTLQEMQRIEMEAHELFKEYDARIEQSYQEIQKRLDVAGKKFDEETEQELVQLDSLLAGKKEQAEQRLNEIITENQQLVEKALTSKKQLLIDQIVGEVVKVYGS